MEISLLFEYGWVLLVLIALEGLLAADNALVLAIMVKHLPEDDRKKHYFTDKVREENKAVKPSGFWTTVLKVELADIAFAVDSILAAVAMAVVLPQTPLPPIGGLDGRKFLVVFAGGIIGLVIMRFAANMFVKLMEKRPGLEIEAFTIVGWVGIKLAIYMLSHPSLSVINEEFVHSTGWKAGFYVVLILIAFAGWFFSKEKKHVDHNSAAL